MTFLPEDVLAFLSLPKTRQRQVVKYISRLEEILDEERQRQAAAKRELAQSLKIMAPPTGIEPVAHCLEGTDGPASLNLDVGRNVSKNAPFEPLWKDLPHRIPHQN